MKNKIHLWILNKILLFMFKNQTITQPNLRTFLVTWIKYKNAVPQALLPYFSTCAVLEPSLAGK